MELSQEAYALIGALVVSNGATALKLFLDWRKAERADTKASADEKTKQEVQAAILQQQITSLTTTLGEVKESLRDLRQDVNNAYGKWRKEHPNG